MLDHSSWNLPRDASPSDIDAVFDNEGRCVFAEVSRKARWEDLPAGQRWAYQSVCGHGPHIAVLITHCVPFDRQIDTCRDIVSMQGMVRCGGDFKMTGLHSGDVWRRLINGWYEDPENVMRWMRNAVQI